METIDLRGRRPVILSAISPRLIALAVAVFLVVIAAVVFGFHYRIKKQEQRTQAVHEQVVASDAAESNRQVVEGEIPIAAVAKPPAPSTGSAQTQGVAAVTAPLVNAAKTVAHPFPDGHSNQQPAADQSTAPMPAVSYSPPPSRMQQDEPRGGDSPARVGASLCTVSAGRRRPNGCRAAEHDEHNTDARCSAGGTRAFGFTSSFTRNVPCGQPQARHLAFHSRIRRPALRTRNRFTKCRTARPKNGSSKRAKQLQQMIT